jgi:glycosyltransferase involved in cell wall biosynthesis
MIDPLRLGVLASHPIQYHAPWFRALAKVAHLQVFFARQPKPQEQGAGFGQAFKWDVDLLSGYESRFLQNNAHQPGVNHFFGCDTPEIAEIIGGRRIEDREQRRFDAFIVCGWNLKSYWQAIRACRRAGIPVLVRGDSQLRTRRSVLMRIAKELSYPIILRQFDTFLSVGQRNAEYLKHYGVATAKICFAPHCVDNEWFAARANNARVQKATMRASWNAGEDTMVLLYVGKFQSIKRPADILDAATRLRARGLQAIVVFVGAGELERELRDQTHRLRVNAQFEGFKNQTELPCYYAAADVLVLPSQSETWGLSVNEAMACGLPAIVSDAVGCAPDLIDEGETGFTFEVGDTRQLAEKLEMSYKLKKNGHDFRAALAAKMRIYSIERAVQGTVEAAEQAAKRHH